VKGGLWVAFFNVRLLMETGLKNGKLQEGKRGLFQG
jgi:hypothetical protein